MAAHERSWSTALGRSSRSQSRFAGDHLGPAEETVGGDSKAEEFTCALVNGDAASAPPGLRCKAAHNPVSVCALLIGFTMEYLGCTAFSIKHLSLTLG